MLTLCIAAAVLAACTALRWFLNRPERKDEAFWNGRIRLTALWNEGAAFSLPMKRTLVAALSILILPLVWVFRRRNPIGAGLALGGGLSNLWERLRHGRVYDYVSPFCWADCCWPCLNGRNKKPPRNFRGGFFT